MNPTTLKDAGFRFTFQKGVGWNWRYEAHEGDIDATDMTNAAFERAVMETKALENKSP